jgi:hypothetical protein
VSAPVQFIVFTGLPGTGKSGTAEAATRELSIPVFAQDWLAATLIRSGEAAHRDRSNMRQRGIPGTNWTGRKWSASKRMTRRGTKSA